MKRLTIFFALIVTSCLIVAGERLASAAGRGMADSLAAMPVGLGYKPMPQDPESYIKIIDPVAKLTEQQKKSITEAFNEMTIDLAESNLKNHGHPDFTQMQAIMKTSQEQIQKVLTPAQVKLLKDADVTSLIKAMAKPVQLTDAQLKAVKDTVDPGDIEAMRQAINDVFTPAQKAAYTKARALSYVKFHYWNAKLTEEQSTQVQETADQLAKNSSLSDTELASKIQEKIDLILTPEQLKIVQPLPQVGGTTLSPSPVMQPQQ